MARKHVVIGLCGLFALMGGAGWRIFSGHDPLSSEKRPMAGNTAPAAASAAAADPGEAPAGTAPSSDIDLYRAALLVTLDDPDEVQFKDEHAGSTGYWCGRYQEQDGQGRKQGYRRFAVSDDAIVYREQGADTLSSDPDLQFRVKAYNKGLEQAGVGGSSKENYFARQVWDAHCRVSAAPKS